MKHLTVLNFCYNKEYSGYLLTKIFHSELLNMADALSIYTYLLTQYNTLKNEMR